MDLFLVALDSPRVNPEDRILGDAVAIQGVL
jgi:hypothetical protein